MRFCKFSNDSFKTINFFYKLIFLFDNMVLLFLTSQLFKPLMLPLLVIEMLIIFYFLFYLFSIYINIKTRFLFILGSNKLHKYITSNKPKRQSLSSHGSPSPGLSMQIRLKKKNSNNFISSKNSKESKE